MRSPFDFVNAILQNKNQLITDKSSESEYLPFMVNRALSFHKDCILQANEMNRRHFVDNKMQNDFLMNIIRKYKRPFTKWAKPEKNDDIECIKIIFGFSNKKAMEALKLISKEDLKILKGKIGTGGVGK
jgi:hypothetical protein